MRKIKGTLSTFPSNDNSKNGGRFFSSMRNSVFAHVFCVFILIATQSIANTGTVIINEFMASNASTLTDCDKEYCDWIELYNTTDKTINLEGWGLTDDVKNPYKWVFPNTNIGANQYVLVYASGKGNSRSFYGFPNQIHTNFKLNSLEGYLALTDDNGTTQTELYPSYPQQYSNVSYGQMPISIIQTMPIGTKTELQYQLLWSGKEPNQAAFQDGQNGVGFEIPDKTPIIPAVQTISNMEPEGYWRLNKDNHLCNNGSLGEEWDLEDPEEGKAEIPMTLLGYEEDNTGILFSNANSPLQSQFPLMNDLSAFTMAGWVYLNSYNVNRTGIFGQNDAVEFGFIEGNANNKMLSLHFWTPSGVSFYHTISMELRQWYHIAVTADLNTVKIYLNGVESYSQDINVGTFGSSSYPFSIGGSTFDALGGILDGGIDEVILSTRAYSAGEIKNIYQNAIGKKDLKDVITSLNPQLWFEMESRYSMGANSGSCSAYSFVSGANISRQNGPNGTEWPGCTASNHSGYFNGKTRIDTEYSTEINGPEFSVSAFVKPESGHTGYSTIISSRNYGPYNGYLLTITPEGKWCFILTETENTQSYLTGPAVQYGVWSLITATFDGTTARLYINGTERCSRLIESYIPNPRAGSNTRIGYGSPDTGEYFMGALDDVLYIGRAITANECSDLYCAAKGIISETGTEDSYQLTELINTDISDGIYDEVSDIYASGVLAQYHFDAPGIDSLTSLVLRLKYADGAIIWLNNHFIQSINASENVPEYLDNLSQIDTEAYALQRRTKHSVLTAKEIDLMPYKEYLHSGENTLLIQGLRAKNNTSDLLVNAEMIVAHINAQDAQWRYFQTSTPKAANGTGTKDLGPIISDLQSTPKLPQLPEVGDPVYITVKVAPSQSPVQKVTLYWKVMFGKLMEQEMFDDGEHHDGFPNDGIYGATINATIATKGQMLRWYIIATDELSRTSRWPLFTNANESEEYLGTIFQDHTIDTSHLPTLHLYVKDTTAMNSGSSTRLSAFYNGEFYDNILIRIRGQSSAGWTKHPYKLDFNKEHRFLYATNTTRVGKVNLMSNYPDKSKIRNSLGYEYVCKSGAAGHWCFPIRIQRNCSFFSVAEMLENGNEDWLERMGWDPDGRLFKIYDALSSAWGAERKSRSDSTDFQDRKAFQNFIDNLDEGSHSIANRVTYAYDNIDLPQTVSYFTALAIISSQDHGHKNFYIHQDCNGSQEWSILPWDIHHCFGRNWTDSSGHFSDTLYTNNSLSFYNQSQQAKEGNRLYNLFMLNSDFRTMYLTRLRTVSDTFFKNENMTAAQSPVAQSIWNYCDLVDPEDVDPSDADLDIKTWGYWGGARYTMREDCQRIIDTYVNGRADWLTGNATLNSQKLPDSQPMDASVAIYSIDFTSSTLQKYICVTNKNSYPVDISDWQIRSTDGALSFTFKPGTVLLSKKTLYVSPNQYQFRNRKQSPTGGENHFVTGPWQGNLSTRGGTLQILNRAGEIVENYTYTGNPSELLKSLRITEIMYHPLPLLPRYPNADDLEFIEIKNISTDTPINLNGCSFTRGITYTFGNITLAPQEYIVLAKNIPAFQARYGNDITPVGPYEGTLSNSGENIRLEDPTGEPILEFAYADSWISATDGEGFSLTINDELAPWNSWGDADAWHASQTLYGTPGRSERSTVEVPQIKINELLTNTTSAKVELFNPEPEDADISGWTITSQYGTPRQYTIATGTTIPANGYLVLEIANTTFQNEIWLFSKDLSYQHGYLLEPQENGTSLGRFVNSEGEEDFVPQQQPTLGAANTTPAVAPIVFTEIMYHPLIDPRDEYLKIVNTGTNDIALDNWTFEDGITYTFPQKTTLEAYGTILLLSFDPNDTTSLNEFTLTYGATAIDPSIHLMGPYSGKLSNSGEMVRLVKPTADNQTITIDKVNYKDSDPWPGKADGKGQSLHRLNPYSYANDVCNWSGKAPQPFAPFIPSSEETLTITKDPKDADASEGDKVSFTVTLSSIRPGITYQWFKDGKPIDGAYYPKYVVMKATPDDIGTYWVQIQYPKQDGTAEKLVSQEAKLFIKQILTIEALDANRHYAAEDPVFTYRIWNSQGKDVTDTIDGQPGFVTDAVLNSPIGTYTITPTQGTLPNDYIWEYQSGQLTIQKATPILIWDTPDPIEQGTPLGDTQLNAVAYTATGAIIPGTYGYSPSTGTVLSLGKHTVFLSFTPNDTTNYTNAGKSVKVTVVEKVIIPPQIRLETGNEGINIVYSGTLETSTDLIHWESVKNAISPYPIPTLEKYRYYRVSQ